jgi:hypothetical protein
VEASHSLALLFQYCCFEELFFRDVTYNFDESVVLAIVDDVFEKIVFLVFESPYEAEPAYKNAYFLAV